MLVELLPATVPAPNLSAGAFMMVAAVMLCAGYARGYAGFGSSAVIMAALTLILTPAELVPVAAAMEVAASSVQLRGVRHHIDGRVLVLICAGAIIGTPLGVYALAHLPAEETKIALLAIILTISLVLLLQRTRALPLTSTVLSAVGVASGIVGGLAAVG
ncbi:MAG: sulfite exporter TauE/SafE family protein, partial [Pseudomonadota bacterium]